MPSWLNILGLDSYNVTSHQTSFDPVGDGIHRHRALRLAVADQKLPLRGTRPERRREGAVPLLSVVQCTGLSCSKDEKRWI